MAVGVVKSVARVSRLLAEARGGGGQQQVGEEVPDGWSLRVFWGVG